ncbi:MAG: hypothetical protein F6J96_06535 [Symploca sp. SIO1C2]|nr:hypothetical protein [Symploca sp. SIO1C2]
MGKTGERIKGGVLIIGSLFWQDGSTRQPWDLQRKNWRDKHLILANQKKVTAPIRYGRYSAPTNINELYTMVLSKNLDNGFSSPNMGEAYVVELRPKFNQQDFTEQLNSAVKELSIAEGVFTRDSFFMKNWCTISILINQNSPFAPLITSTWSKAWKNEVNQYEKLHNAQNYYQRFRQGSESPVITQDGILDLNPFHPIDENTGKPSPKNIFDEAGYDFILAAVTVPQNKGQKPGTRKNQNYPNPETIGKLAKYDKRQYFQHNRQWGIKTFQDEQISQYCT